MSDAKLLRAVAMEGAIVKATAFLRQRLRSGEYGLACVGTSGKPQFSDNKGHVFVAAFITEAMLGLLDEIDRTIILVRILSEENGGLWGFSPPGPRHSEKFRVFHVDADDTAYVIRTLRSLGVNRTPECLLRFYRERQRLFVTFDSATPPSLTVERSAKHNFLAHPEVNANVFLALRGTHLDGFINHEVLRQTQDDRGFWPSYFYPSLLFGTVLALEIVQSDPTFAAATTRALESIIECQNSDGSWGSESDPYETALAVAALAGREHYCAPIRRGIDYLLATMTTAGSWTSRACIWEFHADSGDVWRAFDAHHTFVSAWCAVALRRAVGQVASFE